MKKFLFALLLLLPVVCPAKQRPKNTQSVTESVNGFGIYGGMGVHGTFAPSIVDHLNSVGQSMEHVSDFGTAVEFFVGCEMPVSPSWGVKGEYAFLFKSYSLDATSSGKEDFRYDVYSPTVMAQYVIPGKGFFIKFGAGGGYHWGTINVRTAVYGEETLYKARGIGARAEAEGQTAFDAHLFGYISASLGFEALGKVASDQGVELKNGSGGVSLNYFTAGVRFGLMYYF